MATLSKVPLQKNYKMDKDSVANVVSFTGVGAAVMEWQPVLTIILLVTGIILNVVRIRAYNKKTEE